MSFPIPWVEGQKFEKPELSENQQQILAFIKRRIEGHLDESKKRLAKDAAEIAESPMGCYAGRLQTMLEWQVRIEFASHVDRALDRALSENFPQQLANVVDELDDDYDSVVSKAVCNGDRIYVAHNILTLDIWRRYWSQYWRSNFVDLITDNNPLGD